MSERGQILLISAIGRLLLVTNFAYSRTAKRNFNWDGGDLLWMKDFRK